jgi:hypothetical protein
MLCLFSLSLSLFFNFSFLANDSLGLIHVLLVLCIFQLKRKRVYKEKPKQKVWVVRNVSQAK